jgi:hypothetical protein
MRWVIIVSPARGKQQGVRYAWAGRQVAVSGYKNRIYCLVFSINTKKHPYVRLVVFLLSAGIVVVSPLPETKKPLLLSCYCRTTEEALPRNKTLFQR